MATNDAVAYKDYMIYPMALYVSPEEKWQPMALITRDTQEGLTLPRSQSFPQLSIRFDEEEAALGYAVQYGQMLIDGKQQGLTI
jgi:hypothetical protein